MKNRKREIRTSGSVRDEGGRHPHLLGRRRFLHLAAGATALPAVSRITWAQTYPARPITMIAPFAVGGATDVIARMLAERMKSSLGQPIIVEDVTGAAGTIAVGRVVRAAPDGYTLSLGNNSSHVVAGATYAIQYDLLKDLEPVASLVSNPELVVAKKALPANDLMGLIAWLKANADKATQGGAASAVSLMSPASSSKEKRPRGFSSYLIGEPLRPSRTWWQVRSTW